jgi:hypothetical protein
MRLQLFVVLAAVLPFPLAAQQRSDNPISDSFRDFSYYGVWLMSAFDSIPAGKYSFRPTPAQQSVGYIAQHLENANYELCARFSGLARPTLANDVAADTTKAKWPKDTLVARLKASFVFCRDAMARLDDRTLGDSYPVGPANAARTSTRTRDVVLFITDLADHYSQLAGYMRQLGMVPPSAQPRTR